MKSESIAVEAEQQRVEREIVTRFKCLVAKLSRKFTSTWAYN